MLGSNHGEVRLLTRNGLNCTHKYPQIAAASVVSRRAPGLSRRRIVRRSPDAITSFSMIQMASDTGNAAGLVFFLFDLPYLDGEDLTTRPVIERKAQLAGLLSSAGSPLQYSDHQIGLGPAFYEKACALSVEGSSRNEPMPRTRSEIADYGSRSNASTARNSW